MSSGLNLAALDREWRVMTAAVATSVDAEVDAFDGEVGVASNMSFFPPPLSGPVRQPPEGVTKRSAHPHV